MKPTRTYFSRFQGLPSRIRTQALLWVAFSAVGVFVADIIFNDAPLGAGFYYRCGATAGFTALIAIYSVKQWEIARKKNEADKAEENLPTLVEYIASLPPEEQERLKQLESKLNSMSLEQQIARYTALYGKKEKALV